MNKWRYKLPCGHRNVKVRASVEIQGSAAYDKTTQKKVYYCSNCNKHFKYKIDLKTGNEIAI